MKRVTRLQCVWLAFMSNTCRNDPIFLMWKLSFDIRTCSTPMSSSAAPRCVSCASWRSRSCWSLSCRPSAPAWSTATVTCAGTPSWLFTPSTGTESCIISCISLKNERTGSLMVRICFRNFEHLIPDAPELIHDFLVNEKDASCKRNAFMMLIHADQVCSVSLASDCVPTKPTANLTSKG